MIIQISFSQSYCLPDKSLGKAEGEAEGEAEEDKER